MNKVAWGVISTAKIGLNRVLPGMKKSAWCDIRAVASRDEGRARTFANAVSSRNTMSLPAWPGPPASTNSGSGSARARIAGATATCRLSLSLPPESRGTSTCRQRSASRWPGRWQVCPALNAAAGGVPSRASRPITEIHERIGSSRSGRCDR